MIKLDTLLERLTFPILEDFHSGTGDYLLSVRNKQAADLGNPALIHIITATELDHADSFISGACFIIGKPSRKFSSVTQEAVLFSGSVNPDQLLTQCNLIITEYERFCSYKTRLDLMIQAKPDFPSVFHHFSSFYDNPVCFGDSGGSILFYGNLKEDISQYDVSIRYWVSQGHVPYEYSRKNGNTEGAAKVASSPIPVIMDSGFASQFRRMSYRTCKMQNRYNNYFCIVEAHHPYLPFDKDVLIYTADLVSAYFSPTLLNEMESPRNHVLRSLLAGKITSPEAMTDRMQRCHISSSSHYQIALILLHQEPDQPSSEKLVYFRNMLNNTESMCIQIIRNQELIVLVQANGKEELDSRTKKIFPKFLEDGSVRISFSSPFCNIMEAVQKYREARLAYETGIVLQPEQMIFFFPELNIPILLSLADQQENLSGFLTNGILQLYQTDQRKNTEYFDTLFTYLQSGSNILECAKKLHIHRNTAIYRLNKAKQAVDTDFNSFDDVVRLYLSMQYIRHLLPQKES